MVLGLDTEIPDKSLYGAGFRMLAQDRFELRDVNTTLYRLADPRAPIRVGRNLDLNQLPLVHRFSIVFQNPSLVVVTRFDVPDKLGLNLVRTYNMIMNLRNELGLLDAHHEGCNSVAQEENSPGFCPVGVVRSSVMCV